MSLDRCLIKQINFSHLQSDSFRYFLDCNETAFLGSLGKSLFSSIFHEALSHICCEFPHFCLFWTFPPGQVPPGLSLSPTHSWKWKVPWSECSAENYSNKLFFSQLLCPKLPKKHKHCEERNTRTALSHEGLITFFNITPAIFPVPFLLLFLQCSCSGFWVLDT